MIHQTGNILEALRCPVCPSPHVQHNKSVVYAVIELDGALYCRRVAVVPTNRNIFSTKAIFVK